MRRFAAVVLLVGLAAAQETKPAAPAQPETGDRVLLVQRELMIGELLELDSGGNLVIKRDGKTSRFPLEDVSRVLFEKDPKVVPATGQKLSLVAGGLLTGTLGTYGDGGFSIETVNGAFTIAKRDVKSISLGAVEGAIPELKEDNKKDVLLYVSENDKGVKEMKVEYGDLVKIDKEKVFLKVGEEEKSFARTVARVVHLSSDRPKADTSTGWFTKLLFKNGDKLVGVLRAIGTDKITVFSHYVGTVTFPKKAIHSVTFVPIARMTVGNLMVCDQNGVHEYDRTGKKIWSYNQNVSYPWSAQKLENGNVLISNTNYNQVIEVKPNEGNGGKVEWQLDNVQYPYDAIRLENGNTLVAEYYASQVAEYDHKDKTKKWQTGKVSYPISVQRLESGNTLIASNYGVVEIDNKGQEKWRANMPGVQPWRATRLDNGNTLVVDLRRGAVTEITSDKKSDKVWSVEGLQRPVAAIRMDDGNTLILEQGSNQIIEVDHITKKSTPVIKNLNYPLYMSTY